MIAAPSLDSWLRDPARQQSTMLGVAAAATALRSAAAAAALHEALGAMTFPTAEDVLAAGEAFTADGSAVAGLVAPLCEAARRDPFFRPPLRTGSSIAHAGLVIFDHPLLTLFLSAVTPDGLAAKRAQAQGGRSISFGGHRAGYRIVHSGGATLSFWEAPPCRPDFTAASAGMCRRLDRRVVSEGEWLMVDGARRCFVIDHLVSDLVFVQAQTPLAAAPLAREYDSETFRFFGATSTDDGASRMGLMLSLLRDMDRRDAAPLFAGLLREPHFHTRWHVMRELLALDPDLALPHLRDMAREDPHPEVRAAAGETLRTCFPEFAAEMELARCPA